MMRTRMLTTTAVWGVLVAAGGCDALDVTDPTRIEEADVANPTGADMMRTGAFAEAYRSFQTIAFYGGVLTDEFFADLTAFLGQIDAVEMADRRMTAELEASWSGFPSNPYGVAASARFKAAAAIPLLQEFAPAEARGRQIAQMFALRGFIDVLMAESFCSGFPLNTAVENRVIPGDPLSTDQVFEAALVELDSAAAQAAGDAEVMGFVRVLRGRALLGLGRYVDAADAVREVPTEFVAEAEYDATTVVSNGLSFFTNFTPAYSVADGEGGNGLGFVSAADPRVEVVALGKSRDGSADMYAAAKYPDRNAPIVMASGVEARLIAAEAALAAGDPAWLAILNELRASQVTPALSPLDDPGTADARIDLLFRERAFWLFATGHRLGDLRRLIARYGRTAETAFPAGAYRLGGLYESGTSLPFLAELEARHNPKIAGCFAG